MSSIVTRIKEFIDENGISVAAFEKSVGMSNASFGKSLKNGGAIGSDKIENILRVYPQLSPTWLLTGVGEMTQNEPVNTNVDADDSHTYDKLLNKITEQAIEIGTLRERIRQLERQKGHDASDANASAIANAG